ncbi:response regulator [Leptolyngbya sp. FACHB-8]|uniref:ATP-binding response regulator n=1 Tax=unclassified Leptolyngbya TaxID=2650499 RepID=UPI001686905E|nr:response regulator [Leptolyngbya sp. FACHB-8]MBD1913258.1 response regulator [Leptolyngbya sp. FACHB-8]
MSRESSTKADILIIDDAPDNLRLLSTILSERGYKVRGVINGSAALMGAQAQPPDLILLDVNMPGINGYEVCRLLKENTQTNTIPVIFISALNEVIDKVKAFSVGGVDYICKPFQVEEVMVRIETQLSLRRLQAELQQALAHERSLNQQIEAMAAIEERNRIAREIHDSLGHSLTALTVQLQASISVLQTDPVQAQVFLTQAYQLSKTAMLEVRQSVKTLRADQPDQASLEATILDLVEGFRQVTGIIPLVQIDIKKCISLSVSRTIHRIVQEALTNISKYAQATQVQIDLVTIRQASGDCLCLTLKDNGKGFDCHQHTAGFGLQGMQERVSALAGEFHLTTASGAGCQIEVRFPLSSGAL